MSRPSRIRAGDPGTLLVLLGMALMSLAAGDGAAAHGVRQFDNGLWWNGNAFVPGTWYSVEGTLRRSAPPGATIESIDLRGGRVLPAMGNAHRHGLTNQFDADNALLLSHGVFYVSNPNSILRLTRPARQRAASRETVDVRYSNGGLTSTGGHPTQIYEPLERHFDDLGERGMDGEAYYLIDVLDDVEARWPEIVAGEPDFLKLYLERGEHHAVRRNDPAFVGKRGLDPRLIAPLVERAHREGLRVSVHVTSTFDFHTAVAAGADEIAHLPLEPIDPADAERAAQQGTVVVTTTLSHRPHDEVADIDALHTGNLRLLQQHGVRLVLGTDSAASVIDEARNLRRLGVYDNSTLLTMLTHDTPQWIFPDRRLGSLEDGAEADFVVVEGDPLETLEALDDVQLVVKGGHVLDLEASTNKPGIANRLGHIVMSQGIDAAIDTYHRLRREEPDDWDFSEPQLDALGYAMLRHDQTEGAIRIFELNTQMFPDGSNAWDSLAEARLAAGDTLQAIADYRRSLGLDPQNDNARQHLQDLGAPPVAAPAAPGTQGQ